MRVSQNTLNTSGGSIYVQGRYAYLADSGTTNAFEVWDVSNPSAPVRVSQNTVNAEAFSIIVQGRYAYITDFGTTNTFEIWDISNPAAPVRVSQNPLNQSGSGIYVQGRSFRTVCGWKRKFCGVRSVGRPRPPSVSRLPTRVGAQF